MTKVAWCVWGDDNNDDKKFSFITPENVKGKERINVFPDKETAESLAEAMEKASIEAGIENKFRVVQVRIEPIEE